MFKVLGCILIVIGATLAGFIYGDELKKRVRQLGDIERSILQLQNEIVYTYSPLPGAIENVAHKCGKPLNMVFYRISQLLDLNEVDKVYDAFKVAFDENLKDLSLKKDDIQEVLDLAKSLGETDIEGQKKIFSLTIENIKKKVVQAESNMNKNLKMYRYLGFSIGCLVVIMLI